MNISELQPGLELDRLVCRAAGLPYYTDRGDAREPSTEIEDAMEALEAWRAMDGTRCASFEVPPCGYQYAVALFRGGDGPGRTSFSAEAPTLALCIARAIAQTNSPEIPDSSITQTGESK